MESKIEQQIQKALYELLKCVQGGGSPAGAGLALLNVLVPQEGRRSEILRMYDATDVLKSIVVKKQHEYLQQADYLNIEPPDFKDHESLMWTVQRYGALSKHHTGPLKAMILLYAHYFSKCSKGALEKAFGKAERTINEHLQEARAELAQELQILYPHLDALLPSDATVESTPKAEAQKQIDLPSSHPQSMDDQHNTGNTGHPPSHHERISGPDTRHTAGIMFNNSIITIVEQHGEPELTTENAQEDGIQVDHLPNIANELQSSFVILSMVIVFVAALMWPTPTVGVLVAFIIWRTISNAWCAYKNWRTLSSTHGDRWLYAAYLGYWVWVLCLALYTATGVPYVLATDTFWSRLAFILQCLVVSGGIVVLSHTDMLFAIYRRAEAHKHLGLLKIGEARARRAWKRRWTIAYYYVVIFLLFSIVMLVIYLGDFIDVIVETMLF